MFLSCPRVTQMSRDASADANFIGEKTAVLSDTMKGIFLFITLKMLQRKL
jgi:hypothetical protein